MPEAKNDTPQGKARGISFTRNSSQNKHPNIGLIIGIIVAFVIILGLLIFGGCYYLYKIGSTPTPKTSQKTPEKASWQTHANNRFNFSIQYPNSFTAKESVNGDGVSLTSSSPAISVNVFGKNNSDNQSIDEYLNEERANLFKGSEGASEIEANDATLGDLSGEERIWQYSSPVDGSSSIEIRTSASAGSVIYTVEMIIAQSDYSQYKSMYDQIIASFKQI